MFMVLLILDILIRLIDSIRNEVFRLKSAF